MFVIASDGVGMELELICIFENWPTPKTFKDIQVVLGFHTNTEDSNPNMSR
jgi:hypothetical protein